MTLKRDSRWATKLASYISAKNHRTNLKCSWNHNLYSLFLCYNIGLKFNFCILSTGNYVWNIFHLIPRQTVARFHPASILYVLGTVFSSISHGLPTMSGEDFLCWVNVGWSLIWFRANMVPTSTQKFYCFHRVGFLSVSFDRVNRQKSWVGMHIWISLKRDRFIY